MHSKHTLPLFTAFITLLLYGLSMLYIQANNMDGLDKQKPIEVGNKLTYSVIEDSQEPQIIFVDEQGLVNIPLIGRIPATGKTCHELALVIKNKLEQEYYHQASVLIHLFKEDESRGKVYTLGQVVNQGPISIPKNDLLTVTKSLMASGGFTQLADSTSVTIIRKDEKNPKIESKIIINVRDILEKGDLSKDIVLRNNDVIFVPEKGDLNGKVFVVGEIKSPGYYNIPPGKEFTISQAILAAGGFTEFSNQTKVKLVRGNESLDPKERTRFINVEKIFKKGDRSQDLPLNNNDMLIIEENWINF